MSRRNAGSKFLSFVSVLRESKRKMKMLERSFGRREFFSFFLGEGEGGEEGMMRETLVGLISMEFFSLSAGRMICCY